MFLNLLIDQTGSVEQTETVKSSGSKAYDEAVLAAAQQYRFASGTLDGQPEKFWIGCVVLPPKVDAI